MNPIKALRYLWRATITPGSVFNAGEKPSARLATMGLIYLLLAATFLLFLSAFLFGLDTTTHESGYTVRTGDVLAFQVVTPIRRLLFPLYWLAYAVFVFLLRYGMLFVLDESGRSPRVAWALTATAAAAPVSAGFLLGLMNNLLPLFDPNETVGPLLVTRFVISLLIFAAGFILEARVWILGSWQYFEQKFRRSVLTYLTPFFSALVLAAGWIVLGSI